ncbi:MAG: GAF domain-containing protein [Anaerolineales bacterium]|nr:GAF domain-containing protein [Anaerolineales bacterium]
METGPLGAAEETSSLYRILARANRIASNTELDELLDQMLDLIILVCGANAGTLYLLDPVLDELVFKVVKGPAGNLDLIGQRISIQQGIAGATLQSQQPIVVEDLAQDPRWYGPIGQKQVALCNAISIPLLLPGKPIGVVQVFNYTEAPVQLVQLLGNRMASEIDKAMLLQASQQRGARLQALVDIIGIIGSTLDRDQVLRLIVGYARDLLHVEASSLFLIDEAQHEIVLHISTNPEIDQTIRIPFGQGIIGHVIESGETVLVSDATQDVRHYSSADSLTGMKTCSILAVPLTTRSVQLGQERGTMETRIIGGLEAVNKLENSFRPEDAELLRTLANQAATVLQIAELYGDATELFLDTIQAMVAAIDAKDPYTEGHSKRVSEFSVAIGRQLQLSPEQIHHLRIGALLHDVGKIGVPDHILTKPGQLTTEEFERMKEHPAIGAEIMGNVRMLRSELPALAEHHERIDGQGYPNGLDGAQISLFGRIVAVADVFDALTSDRPYRAAMATEEVLDLLQRESGTHLDGFCVQALIRAYLKGDILTQKARQQLGQDPD